MWESDSSKSLSSFIISQNQKLQSPNCHRGHFWAKLLRVFVTFSVKIFPVDLYGNWFFQMIYSYNRFIKWKSQIKTETETETEIIN